MAETCKLQQRSDRRMLRPLAITIGLIAIQIAGGCQRKEAPKTTPVVATTVSQDSAVKVQAKEENKPTTETTKAPPTVNPQPEPIKPPPPDTVKKDRIYTSKSERVAILTLGGPLVVDILLTVDGRPHTDVFDSFIEKLLAAADTDKDGKPTWQELAANSDYLAAQGGTPPPPRQLQMQIDQFDRNRNRQIERDEAALWLGRNTSTTARAFNVRGTRFYRPVPSSSSRVWKLLDLDDDNRLSKSELSQAAATLHSLDDNDDGMIAPQELQSLKEQLQADGSPRSTLTSSTNPYAAIDLKPDYEVNRLEYLLADLYSQRQTLGAASFPVLGRVYKSLDTDANDQLKQDELAAMQSMAPQLKLAADFRPADHRASLSVIEHIPEISVDHQPAPDRMILSLGNTRLLVMVSDRTANQPPAARSATGQVQMSVHDQCDELGEIIDLDGDGRLGEREIATCAERLMKYDTNGDAQLSNDELPYTMIVAIVLGDPSGDQSLDRPVFARPSSTSTDLPPWFIHADYNADGDVSPREFLGSKEQFSQLDKNHDGFLSTDEAKTQTASTKSN
jgi:Ca2+-binding EF-hand superfamily protein